MNPKHIASAALLLLLGTAAPSHSQAMVVTTARVSSATLPLPLPGATPLPPDQLRAHNPWNLAMTGAWRFELTHGHIEHGGFISKASESDGVMASSNEAGNLPQNAFDGLPHTRWCADSAMFPQSLQADMGQMRHVTGVTLAWEHASDTHQFKIEGSLDGKAWQTLADLSAAPGAGDGPVALSGPVDVRFVRILVTGVGGGHWASLFEVQIHITENGQETIWRSKKTVPKPDPLDDNFTQAAFDDQKWDTVSVPSNWEMEGYSIPTYNSVDDTVGLYRRSVAVPAAWKGRRIFWRFDGALDGAEVFVNGVRAGYHESGYTAFDVDLTSLIHPGQRNLLAVRVSKTTPSVDCETGDFQCMGGIYRDTSLIAVPQTYVRDITVRTPLAANYRDATLQATLQVSGTPGAAVGLSGTVVGVDGKKLPVHLAGQGKIGQDGTATVVLSTPVIAPRLWSAESPNLYYLVLQLTQNGKPTERVEQRFGFRQVEIKNDVVLWNGRPIKCTGVCRHDFWPTKGFALSDTEWNKDLSLMKAANVNAIRTSHYNHASRFLELCEERGMYILDEVPFCWINEKNNDPTFAPALLLRAADTLGRDKNRPCVLSWSIGNENGVGKNSQTVIDFVKAHDPTRPAFVSQGGYWGPKGQSFQDMHYPLPADVANYLKNDATKLPAQYSEQPHIFYQKYSQEYDPGVSDLWSEVMTKIWDGIWPAPTVLGAFVWEWQNQGIADKNADHTRDFYYGPDRLRQENNKGIMDAFRNPKPEWWMVKMTYSPVAVAGRTVVPAGGTCAVALTNHYSFTNLNELSCRWIAMKGDAILQKGTQRVSCPPLHSTMVRFPAPAGMTALRLEFHKTDGTDSVALLAVPDAPTPAPPVPMASGSPLTVDDANGAIRVTNSVQEIIFDKTTGGVRFWRVRGHEMLTGSPALNLGEGMASTEKGYYHAAAPSVLTGASVTAQTPASDGRVRVTVTGKVLGGGQPLGTLTCTYDIRPNAELAVGWQLNWTAPDTLLWEAGLALPVPAQNTKMVWWRDSFFTIYPAEHIGEPSGVCDSSQTLFRASKRGLHWLTLTDAQGMGLALLQSGTSLVARANPGPQGTTLLASEELAVPHEFDGFWVDEHDIHAVQGKTLSGSFILRAADGSKAHLTASATR